MRLIFGVFLCCLFLAIPNRSVAQEVEEYIEITTTDGSTYVGQILSESNSVIHFQTASGVKITIPTKDVRSRKTIRGRVKKNGVLRLDPTASRLFFSSTARPLRKRDAYASVYELFLGFFATGVTDRLILGGGISFLPGSAEQLYYVAPKYSLYHEKDRSLAVGVFAGGVTGETGMGGILYGVSTFGPPDRALSIGAGFLFGGGEIESTPILLVGGEKQISSKFKLMTENYIIPIESAQVIVSGGFRIIGGSLTTDLSLFTMASLLEEGGFPFLPWLSFTYNFDY